MVKDISALVCSQSCRSDSILQKSDAFTSNRLSRNIKAVIAISRSFALQKTAEYTSSFILNCFYGIILTIFVPCETKSSIAAKYLAFANNLTCRTGFYIKPNFWICTDFVFVFCFIDHFSEFLAAMKTPLYIGQRARHQKLHLLYALQKGRSLSKYYRYFSFRSLVKIFCLVQNWRRKACALVFLSAFTAYRNTFLSN